jgi:predicted RNA methylase
VAGHRHSSDDVLTAHYALSFVPDAELVLDLGTGIGTVGLMVLSRLSPTARLVGVEAQAMSFRLLLANIEGNGVEERVEAKVGDLRDFVDARRFDLITGSPPYFKLGSGVLPDDPQKVAARFEVRGDVSDYARAAAPRRRRHVRLLLSTPHRERARAVAAAASSPSRIRMRFARSAPVHAVRCVAHRHSSSRRRSSFDRRRRPQSMGGSPQRFPVT